MTTCVHGSSIGSSAGGFCDVHTSPQRAGLRPISQRPSNVGALGTQAGFGLQLKLSSQSRGGQRRERL